MTPILGLQQIRAEKMHTQRFTQLLDQMGVFKLAPKPEEIYNPDSSKEDQQWARINSVLKEPSLLDDLGVIFNEGERQKFMAQLQNLSDNYRYVTRLDSKGHPQNPETYSLSEQDIQLWADRNTTGNPEGTSFVSRLDSRRFLFETLVDRFAEQCDINNINDAREYTREHIKKNTPDSLTSMTLITRELGGESVQTPLDSLGGYYRPLPGQEESELRRLAEEKTLSGLNTNQGDLCE